MNELQLGLVAFGTVGVLAVVAYNKWQERRHRRLVEQVLRRDHADVLLDGSPDGSGDASPAGDVEPPAVAPAPRAAIGSERREPVLVAEALPPADEMPVAGDDPEAPADEGGATMPGTAAAEPMPLSVPVASPAARPVAYEAADPPARPAAAAEAGVTAPEIDYVASFELVEPVSGYQILASQRELLARVSKPVDWMGCSDRSGQWERVVDEGSYRRLRVGLLLADRRGPLGEADLLTFHGAMQNLADELMAVADMPPRESALAAAIALDRFCANVDIQIGINVVSKGTSFPGTKIRALAEAAGMVVDGAGQFVRCDDDGNVLYTMSNQEAAGFSPETMKTMSTHALVFVLDVPRVSHGDRVFAQMLDLARRMAEALNGVLVDDNRRPLTEAMLDPFRRQIGQYQAQLVARGLPAGSPPTLRLFA